MNELSSTVGIVAAVAAVAALVALAVSIVLAGRLRRLRRAQMAVLGGGSRDLVAHAAALQGEFARLRGRVEEDLGALHGRVGDAERRLDGTIAYRALVRYDAYNEMSGRQSMSIALLDASRSGVVLSSIHHRDQARLYAKQVIDGKGELELSPEEAEAVRLALDAGAPGTPADKT